MTFSQLNRKPIEVLKDETVPIVEGKIEANTIKIGVKDNRTMFDFNHLARGMLSHLESADSVAYDRWRTIKRSRLPELRPDLFDLSIRGKRFVSLELFETMATTLDLLGGKMYIDGYPDFRTYIGNGYNYALQPGRYLGRPIIKIGKADLEQWNPRLSVYANKEKSCGERDPRVYVRCRTITSNTSKGETSLKAAFGIRDEEYYEKTGKIRYINTVNGDNEMFDLSFFDDCPEIILNEEEDCYEDEAFVYYVANKFKKALFKLALKGSDGKKKFEVWYGDENVYRPKPKKAKVVEEEDEGE